MSYDNTNSGALFTAKEKRNPNSPDYTGSVNVEGTDYFVSAWVKTDRNRNKYLSMALTKKNQQTGPGGKPGYIQDEDDRPF